MQKQRLLGRYIGAVLTCVAFILAIYFFHQSKIRRLSPFPIEKYAPANSTLGFGAIAPVSRTNSVRREGLIFAANVTGIDLTIPQQPSWTYEDTQSMKASSGSTMTYGSSLAWLGHLNALKWFLSTDLESALILEDDVDWDIHLRSIQVPAAAAAVRLLTDSKRTHDESSYWGPSGAWDLLYLGHCGDFFPKSAWNEGKNIPHVTFPDQTMPQPKDLHPYTQKFLESIDVPAQNRLVHKTTFPLCTFGYAVTRASAKRLVNELANREPEGGCLAYDVRIHEICRDNPDFKCLTVNPELMHHVDAESEIGNMDDKRKEQGMAGDSDADQIPRRETPNIACGARKQALFTGDPDVLNYLQSLTEDEKSCLPANLATVEKDMRLHYPY